MKAFIQPEMRVIYVNTNSIIATSGEIGTNDEVGNGSVLAPGAYTWDEEE